MYGCMLTQKSNTWSLSVHAITCIIDVMYTSVKQTRQGKCTTWLCICTSCHVFYTHQTRQLRQRNMHQSTETFNVFFSKLENVSCFLFFKARKSELPQVGFDPTSLYSLDQCYEHVTLFSLSLLSPTIIIPKGKTASCTVARTLLHFMGQRSHTCCKTYMQKAWERG